MRETARPLVEIPRHRLPGPDWPRRLLAAERARAAALLSAGVRGWPSAAVRSGDALSRRWLARAGNPYLAEIEALAGDLGRPGGVFLNVTHEWGCTSRVAPSAHGRTDGRTDGSANGGAAELLRVLDWPFDGLGRSLVAADLEGPAGPWTNLTWPGFAGVVQASAPGRFAAAFNQAPLRRLSGLKPLDWAAARRRWWAGRGLPPAHLLRQAFETCEDYAAARRLLAEAPLALPAIFLLAGLRPQETCVIERLEDRAHLIQGAACAANHFAGPFAAAGRWRPRTADSAARAAALARWQPAPGEGSAPTPEAAVGFLAPPVRNRTTRLALRAEAATGKLWVQGLERDGPATYVLALRAEAPETAESLG